MISTTAEYALRAVVYLASTGGKTIVREEVARQTQVPSDYLVKVMKALDSAEIIVSIRGPGGGYRLERSADELTVYDVVSAVTELPRIKTCPLGIEEHVNLCPLHARLDEVAALTEAAFRATPISDLLPRKSRKPKCTFPTTKKT